MMCFNICIGTNPPPEIVIPESTLGGIGTTDPTMETSTMGSPDPTMGSPDPTMGSPDPTMGSPDPTMGSPDPTMGSPDPTTGVTGPGNTSGAASIAALCHLILLTVVMVILL